MKNEAIKLIGALRGHPLPEGAKAAYEALEAKLHGVHADEPEEQEEEQEQEETAPEGEEKPHKSKSKKKKHKVKDEAPAAEVKA